MSQQDTTSTGTPSHGRTIPVQQISTNSETEGTPKQPADGGSYRTRPVQTRGHYPERFMTWYQISRSDLRNLGAAGWITTLFAAAGTYGLSLYLDFSKDIQLSEGQPEKSVELLISVANIAYWGWLFCWTVALFAFLWREHELVKIREEHGELPLWKRIWRWPTNKRT